MIYYIWKTIKLVIEYTELENKKLKNNGGIVRDFGF